MQEFTIGVDLGGTNLRAIALTKEGERLAERRVPTNGADGAEAVLDRIADLVRATERDVTDGRSVGVGLGVPGLIRLPAGIVSAAPNVWADLDVAAKSGMEDRLGTPVEFENDANAAALGEYWVGAGRDVDDLILMTLGTGVGGGIVAGGRIVQGQDGMAGEIGHTTLDPASNVRCGCGNLGCVETETSATAIVRRARAALGDSPSFTELDAAGRLTAATIAELATSGDRAAIAIYERVGRALGVAVGNLISVFNFPLYLFGGGVVSAWDLFAPSMLAEVERRCLTFRLCGARIERAELGPEAGLIGAAFLPWQAKKSSNG